MGKSSGGGGEQPDLIGAAREEGEQARETAREETIANRPNQYNPWGSTTWDLTQVEDPRTGQMIDQWAQTETLSPELQAQLDAQFGQQTDRAEMGQGMFNDFMNNYQPMDFSQFGSPIQMGQQAQVPQFQGMNQFQSGAPQIGQFDYQDTSGLGEFGFDQTTSPFEYDAGTFRQDAEDAAYQKATARLDPQFQQQEQQLETKLRQQGLNPGDQAWQSSIQDFNNRRNDAYEQARLGSTAAGRDESNLMYGQQMGAYQTNLGQQDQAYNQALQGFQQNQSLQDQAYQQGLGAFGANLGAQGQQFQQDLGSQQQNWNQALSGWQANAQGQQQQFGQNVQQNQISNALRSQEMQEALQAQGYPLEMIQQIMAGTGLSGTSPSGSLGEG